jgi:hypothetical protein
MRWWFCWLSAELQHHGQGHAAVQLALQVIVIDAIVLAVEAIQ